MRQTCIGTRETDDLRSQVMRRTKPFRRTARSATPGPCAGWIRGLGGRRSDEHPTVHLDRRGRATEPLDGLGPVCARRVRGLREPLARGRGPLESFGPPAPRIARVRQRRSPASTPHAGGCLLLLNRLNPASALSAPSMVRERGRPSGGRIARAPPAPAWERSRGNRGGGRGERTATGECGIPPWQPHPLSFTPRTAACAQSEAARGSD